MMKLTLDLNFNIIQDNLLKVPHLLLKIFSLMEQEIDRVSLRYMALFK